MLDRNTNFLTEILQYPDNFRRSFVLKKNVILFMCTVLLSVFSFAKNKTDDEKFKKPIIRFLPMMKSCRDSGTKQTMQASGKVVVDYEINDKAELHKIKINDEQTTLTDLNLQKCVVDAFKKIKFPKAPKGKTVKITYPVEFSR